MEKDVNVYVLSHKNAPYLAIDEWHTPIQLGKALHNEKIFDVTDDTGDNISYKNKMFLESTGVYWIWKNAPRNGEYIGHEQYRRHFNLDKDLVLDILSDHDIIAPTPIELGMPIEKHYEAFHIGDDIHLCEKIIKEKYPEYANDYDRVIKNDNKLYYSDSYITSWENYDKINGFIFDILFELEKRYGFTTEEDWRQHVIQSGQHSCPGDHKKSGLGWEGYQMETCAFLYERLFTLFIRHNFSKIYEVEYQLVEMEWKKKNAKIMLCCIGRQENAYIREFVSYYKLLGVTNICLYDNNRTGEENFRDAIGDFVDSGFVILKDYRDKPAPCQVNAYNECYQEYKNEYDWFMYFDIDEFMFLNQDPTIGSYLARREFDEFDMIHVNWLLFGDGGHVRNDGRGLLQRITQPLDINQATDYKFPDNFHTKVIVRGGLDNMVWTTNPHSPEITGEACNGTGIKMENPNSPFTPYDYRLAGLRHFTTKTAEEFAAKVKRGFCDTNTRKAESLIQLFFQRNEPTQEKVDIFREMTGIDMSYLLPHVFEGEKNKDVQIFSLCYSKKDFQFLDDAVITPLQVGADNGTDVCKLKDNTGDNISKVNFFYIENTGTYWIWKNVADAKYKGQMQYRRPLSGVTEDMNFDDIFSKYDVITCEPFHHPDHKIPTPEEPMVIPADTVEQGYAFSNCADDLYILEMVVKCFFPDYASDWDKYIKNGPNLYYSNGFIMKSEDFDRYSEFLFKCLTGYLDMANIHSQKELVDHVKYNIEVGKYPRYSDQRNVPNEAIKWQTEIGGFLSERLWTLWLQHNFTDDKIYKVPYIKMEKGMYT